VAIAILVAATVIGCGDDVVLQSIAVTPSPATGDVGGADVQFTATGTYSDSTTSTNISGLTWSSSDVATATIDATTGLATCVGGDGVTPTTITATAPITPGNAQTVSGTAELTCNIPV